MRYGKVEDIQPTKLLGNTLYVGAQSTYTTITLALAAAAAGDTILVSEGTYTETVTFTQDNLTLKAIGSKENTIITQATATAVNFSTKSGCVLEGFTVNVTAADTVNGDFCVSSANDDATEYNHIINCDLTKTSAVAANPHVVIGQLDGNLKIINCNITNDGNAASGTDGQAGIKASGAAGILDVEHCKFRATCESSGAGSVFGINLSVNGAIANVRDCEFDLDATSTTGVYNSGLLVAVASGTFNVYNSKFVIDVGGGTGSIMGGVALAASGVINSYNNIFDCTNGGSGNEYWALVDAGATLNSYGDHILDGTLSNAGTFNPMVKIDKGGATQYYTTITLAMAAAAAGDTILVSEGTYTEAVTFSQDNITLKAIGSRENTIITQANATVVNFSTKSGCVLDGFKVSISEATASRKVVIGANDDATDYNEIKNCNIILDSTSTAGGGYCIELTDGNWKISDNTITITVTHTGSGVCRGIITIGATGTREIRNNKVTIANSGTGGAATNCGIDANIGGTYYITGNNITISSDSTTTSYSRGIGGNAGTAYIIGNTVSVIATSNGLAYGIQEQAAGTMYISGNTIHAASGDSDGKWLNNAGTAYATGNTITGDAAITVGTLYDGYNAIDGMSKSNTQPAFLAHPTTAQTNLAINSEVTIVFGTERFDQGSDFASNTFTAPITGKYQFNFVTYLTDVDTAASYYEVEMITSNKTYRVEYLPDPDNILTADGIYFMNNSILVDMDINDTAYMNFNQVDGTQQTDINTSTFFSGFLVC